MSFLCSLDNFLLKNCFLFWKSKFQNSAHLKRGYFWPTLTFFSHQGNDTKILQHISHFIHTHTYFAHPIYFFCVPNFAKIANLSCMVSLWCDSLCWILFAPFYTHKHVFCSPYWLFLPYQFWKKIRIYQVWFLFGMSPGVDSYSRHFRAINK